MPQISQSECGELLAVWVEKRSSPEQVKQIINEAGYNDSPFFGAEKKKIRAIGEVVTVHSAIAIIAVNKALRHDDTKPIIDAFLLR